MDGIAGTAIYCRPENFPFADLARELGYRTIGIDGPHDVMLTRPEALSQLLLTTEATPKHCACLGGLVR